MSTFGVDQDDLGCHQVVAFTSMLNVKSNVKLKTGWCLSAGNVLACSIKSIAKTLSLSSTSTATISPFGLADQTLYLTLYWWPRHHAPPVIIESAVRPVPDINWLIMLASAF